MSELAEECGLDLALTMIVNIVRLEDFVEAFV